jgi:hypothetical protein
VSRLIAENSGGTEDEPQEVSMRKILFWSGWAVLLLLPIAYGVQIFVTQDLPAVHFWQWLIPAAAVVTVCFSRNPDDVLKHHVCLLTNTPPAILLLCS